MTDTFAFHFPVSGLILRGAEAQFSGFPALACPPLIPGCGPQTWGSASIPSSSLLVGVCLLFPLKACGILVPQPGSNLQPMRWKAKSQAVNHQGSPHVFFIGLFLYLIFGRAHSLALVAGVWSALKLWRSASHLSALVAERRLWNAGSVLSARGLRCRMSGGVLVDLQSSPCPLH